MKIYKLIVNTKSEKYPILIGSGLLQNFSNIIKKYSINSQKYLIIVDENAPKKQLDIIKKNLKTKYVIFSLNFSKFLISKFNSLFSPLWVNLLSTITNLSI